MDRGRRIRRTIRRLAWPAALVAASAAAAWIAARIAPGSDLHLWNFDLPKIDYPLASFFHDALRAGRLPLWNDQLGLGFPLYAEGQIGAFYPPNWLLFQLPPLDALDASRLLHLTIAGTGAGVLVLRLSGSRPGALVAALVAVLGGAITAKLEWTNLVAAYAWLPWILVPLVRRPAPTRAGLAIAGALFGLQALAGHPNTWLLTGITATVLLLAHRPRIAGLSRVVGFWLLGGAVGAAQLLPTAILTTLSVRSQALSSADLFASASTPFDALGLAFQGAFAPVSNGSWNLYVTWYPDGSFALLEAAVYVGLPVIALAFAGLGVRRIWPLLAAITILVAIPVVEAFQPGFILSMPIVNGLRSPVRAYLPAALLLGVVAGVAIGRPVRRRALVRAAIGVGVLVAAYGATIWVATARPDVFNAVVLAVTTFGDAASVAGQHQAVVDALSASWPLALELAAGAAILVVLVAGMWLGAKSRVRRAATGLAAAAVVAIPLVLFGPAPNGTARESETSYAGTSFLQGVAASGPYRFLDLDPPGWYAGVPDQPAAAGIADLRMFSSLDLQATDDLIDQAAHDTPEGATLRRVLGVDVVATFGKPCPGRTVGTADDIPATICRDDAALRPPYLVPAAAVTLEPPAGASPIRPAEATLDLEATLAGAVPVTPDSRDTMGLDVSVDATDASYLWVDRAWWPAWLTFVDGQVAETRRALGGQLVTIPAGIHRVEMRLVPWDALIGAWLGAGALAIAVAWARRAPKPD